MLWLDLKKMTARKETRKWEKENKCREKMEGKKRKGRAERVEYKKLAAVVQKAVAW